MIVLPAWGAVCVGALLVGAVLLMLLALVGGALELGARADAAMEAYMDKREANR